MSMTIVATHKYDNIGRGGKMAPNVMITCTSPVYGRELGVSVSLANDENFCGNAENVQTREGGDAAANSSWEDDNSDDDGSSTVDNTPSTPSGAASDAALAASAVAAPPSARSSAKASVGRSKSPPASSTPPAPPPAAAEGSYEHRMATIERTRERAKRKIDRSKLVELQTRHGVAATSAEGAAGDDSANNADYVYPRFELSEMTLGEVLGKGGFGTVLRIESFSLRRDRGTSTSKTPGTFSILAWRDSAPGGEGDDAMPEEEFVKLAGGDGSEASASASASGEGKTATAGSAKTREPRRRSASALPHCFSTTVNEAAAVKDNTEPGSAGICKKLMDEADVGGGNSRFSPVLSPVNSLDSSEISQRVRNRGGRFGRGSRQVLSLSNSLTSFTSPSLDALDGSATPEIRIPQTPSTGEEQEEELKASPTFDSTASASTRSRRRRRRQISLPRLPHLDLHRSRPHTPSSSGAATPAGSPSFFRPTNHRTGRRSGVSTPNQRMGCAASSTVWINDGPSSGQKLLDYLYQHLPGDQRAVTKVGGGRPEARSAGASDAEDDLAFDGGDGRSTGGPSPPPPPLRQTARFIAAHADDENHRANYAIKRIHPEIVEAYFATEDDEPGDDDGGKKLRKTRNMFLQAATDITAETYFLSVLRSHPHIITLRAVGQSDMFSQDYFLVLDRLYDTLEGKIEGEWKTANESLGKNLFVWHRGKKKRDFWRERLVAVRDLADALVYMHELNIIYRDIKPGNAGFDSRGVLKLFDFGLAKELHPEDETASGTYKLTPNTGSLRYMAPEVGNNWPYNFAADSYSFGILLWEVVTLECPFSNLEHNEIRDRVMKWGQRPKVPDDEFSPETNKLMQLCWDSNFRKRPTMCSIKERLEKEVNKLDVNA